jgi:hypothetical protein
MLYLLFVERGEKRKKKKEMARGFFSQGETCLADCAAWYFPGC